MLIWFHPVSVREWGRWNITKRKTQGRTGGAIWVTEPRHHLTITLQYTQRHRAPLCPCLRERCIVNTVTCQSGPFSPVKQILPFFPLISNWVQLHLPAFAQEPASCRNCFPYKETQSQPSSLRTSSKLSPHRTRPRGLLLEWHKSWCLKTHSSAAGRRDLARDVPCGTCLHSQNSSRPDSVWGALNKTTSIAWCVAHLPPCNKLSPQKDMGDQKKSRLCENIFKYHDYSWGFIFLRILKRNDIFNCMVAVISEFTVYSTLVQLNVFRSCFVFKAKEWKDDNTQEPDMHQMHRAHQLSQSRSC